MNTNTSIPDWALGPFIKKADVNPILGPSNRRFECPLLGNIRWEERGIFNAAAVVKDERVFLVYRANGSGGYVRGVSRLGLAWSADGLHFERHPNPILYPEPGRWRDIELGTGLQDPRLIETDDGRYVLTYACFDLDNCYLFVAASDDLFHWQKHGLAFEHAYNGKYRQTWSKAGAIVCRREGSRMIASKVNGKNRMYWGESDIFAATSDDLIHWTPVETEVNTRKMIYLDEQEIWRECWMTGEMVLKPVLKPRPGRFDGALVEPGPQAYLTEQGILLIYNGCNAGDPRLAPGAYATGQVLFDRVDPSSVLARCTQPFLVPNKKFELEGSIPNVCFANGLVFHKGHWLLYYGAADKFLGVCESPV